MTFQTCNVCHDIIAVVSGHGGISSGVTNDIRLPPPSKTPPRPTFVKCVAAHRVNVQSIEDSHLLKLP
jgi:hypothetical protein